MAKGSKTTPNRKGKGPVRAPAASARSLQTRAASYAQSSKALTVSHREFLTAVEGSSDFEWEQHVLNPGLAESFPWLSALANRFESYRFKKLAFHYVPRCSSLTPGAVMLVFDYDCEDTGPDTLSDAMSYAHANRGSAWAELHSATEACDRDVLPRRFTRNTAEFVSQREARTSDLGCLFICSDGGAVTPWGEIWVEYVVELFTPQLAQVVVPGFYVGLPVGTMDTSLFRGLTKSADEMQTSTGVRCTLTNGVLKFLEDFTGLAETTCVSAAAGGALSFLARNTSDPFAQPAYGGNFSYVASGAGTTGVKNAIVNFPMGTELKPVTVNAVNASEASKLLLTPMKWDEIANLMVTLGTSWAAMAWA